MPRPCREIAELAARTPGLQLLVLHGSRARGDEHAGSDWDFAYLAEPTFEPTQLSVELSRVLEPAAVDLVDLGRAGGLLRYRVASEGKLVFERQPDQLERFVLSAVGFWLDAGPTITQGHEAVLEALG